MVYVWGIMNGVTKAIPKVILNAVNIINRVVDTISPKGIT